MFDGYLLDYYDNVDGCHYLRSSSDLLFLLSLVDSFGSWEIVRGEWIEGIFYPQRLIARSAFEDYSYV